MLKPHIQLYGENFAGKTVLAETLRESYGYNIISLGGIWLNLLKKENPTTDIFSSSEVKAFREAYLKKYGPDKAFGNIDTTRQSVVDGVRAPEVAAYFLSKGFKLVYVSAPKELRQDRSLLERSDMPEKERITLGSLAMNDALHKDAINTLSEMSEGARVENDGMKSPEELIDDLLLRMCAA